MADKKKMSVEDILAACRGGDSGSTTGRVESAGKETESTVSEAPGTVVPPSQPAVPRAVAPAAAGKPGAGMSVADILAAARGGSGEKPPVAAASQPATKAKPAVSKDAKSSV